MKKEELEKAQAQLEVWNKRSDELRQEAVKLERDVASAQKAVLDATLALRSIINRRESVISERRHIKEVYGRLHNEVGETLKALAKAEEEAKAADERAKDIEAGLQQ